MSHTIMQQSYSSTESPNGGGHDDNGSSHDVSYHGVQHKSTNEDSNISKHGDSHILGHGSFNTSHHGGSHSSYLRGSHILPHGSQQVSHHKDHHVSHQEGNHMQHHGDRKAFHHEHHPMSHYGGQQASHHEGHHMSHHRSQPKSNYGEKQMPHHRSHQVSHQKGYSIFHNGGHRMSHYGNHVSHHEDRQSSNYGHQLMSHNGGHHMHYEGHKTSHQGIHQITNKGGYHMSHHGDHSMSNYGGHYISHHGGHHMSNNGGHQMSNHEDRHMAYQEGHHMPHHEGHQTFNHEDSHMSYNGGQKISIHGDDHKSHHEGKHKVPSAHSAQVCKELSFPKRSSFYHGKKGGFSHGHGRNFNNSTGHGNRKSDGLLGVNEKEIMQLLNKRLSSYLGKVRTLEQENAKFERNISDWYKNNPPKTPPDGTHYFRIIEDLQNQISALALENSSNVLLINSAKLAADDYRSKHELELHLGNGTAMDIHNLSMVLQTLNGETGELKMQVQSLEEEIQDLMMSSEEEINYLLTQLGARVNVELNAAPSINLDVALSEIRDEYENLMERNLREAEEMFLERSAELSHEVATGSDQLQSIETELIEMKRCMQALEIELDSEMTLNSALMGTLEEAEAIYGSKLKDLQSMINNAEFELAQIRSDLERQNHEYKKLMDQKTHLELEIATYKRLLDGHDIHVTGHHPTDEYHDSDCNAGHYTEEHAHHTKH